MPQSGMDYWVIGGVIIAIVAVLIPYWQLKKRKPSVDQKMTNSRSSTQTAQRDDVKQTMDNTTDGDQNA
ncbi:hypothetical protein [Yoonia sp.]|uniref:hypothetical protein n=1 Tax=Yoonia sp. TaxID=2212373 RepID=UPI0025DF135D|nr:hypothetical protein [Yoonia sp.]